MTLESWRKVIHKSIHSICFLLYEVPEQEKQNKTNSEINQNIGYFWKGRVWFDWDGVYKVIFGEWVGDDSIYVLIGV